MASPLPQSPTWDSAKSLWSQILNPVLASPTNNIQILDNVSLINGATIINHKLGRMMKGWVIFDVTGSSNIYRSAPLNNSTLTLTSNAAVVCSIGVF